jgi:hypothetical protein
MDEKGTKGKIKDVAGVKLKDSEEEKQEARITALMDKVRMSISEVQDRSRAERIFCDIQRKMGQDKVFTTVNGKSYKDLEESVYDLMDEVNSKRLMSVGVKTDRNTRPETSSFKNELEEDDPIARLDKALDRLPGIIEAEKPDHFGQVNVSRLLYPNLEVNMSRKGVPLPVIEKDVHPILADHQKLAEKDKKELYEKLNEEEAQRKESGKQVRQVIFNGSYPADVLLDVSFPEAQKMVLSFLRETPRILPTSSASPIQTLAPSSPAKSLKAARNSRSSSFHRPSESNCIAALAEGTPNKKTEKANLNMSRRSSSTTSFSPSRATKARSFIQFCRANFITEEILKIGKGFFWLTFCRYFQHYSEMYQSKIISDLSRSSQASKYSIQFFSILLLLLLLLLLFLFLLLLHYLLKLFHVFNSSTYTYFAL